MPNKIINFLGNSAIFVMAMIWHLGFPFLFIWGVNTLLGLTIPYTLVSWAAVILIKFYISNNFAFEFGETGDE